MKKLLVLLALIAGAPADPVPPIGLGDSYLILDAPTDFVPLPIYWHGALTLKNTGPVDLTTKTMVVHVLDGYGKPLFDIEPDQVKLPQRRATVVPLSASYSGGVSVFKFSCDLVLVDSRGTQTTVKLGPVDQNLPPGRPIQGY